MKDQLTDLLEIFILFLFVLWLNGPEIENYFEPMKKSTISSLSKSDFVEISRLIEDEYTVLKIMNWTNGDVYNIATDPNDITVSMPEFVNGQDPNTGICCLNEDGYSLIIKGVNVGKIRLPGKYSETHDLRGI